MNENNLLTKNHVIEMIDSYCESMKMEELSDATIKLYLSHIRQWIANAPQVITKKSILEYKIEIFEKYKVSSANLKIIALNRFFKWLGHNELTVRIRRCYISNVVDNVLSKEEYRRLLVYAYENNRKMYFIMKTIASTGIRIGELKYITVESVKNGSVMIWNKGRYREVYFTYSLSNELLEYCNEIGCISGVIFAGRKCGRPITKCAVWKALKQIACSVNVPKMVVYPHSFRHLFAKEYMEKVGDISELADLLGHSRLETTWIYTRTTSKEKRSKLELLDM